MTAPESEISDKSIVFISSILIMGAVSEALFFHGPQTALLSVTQILLFIWLFLTGLQLRRQSLELPKTILLLSITLFWAYLGLSVSWSKATSLSIMTFWWVGSLYLVFWIYTLSPQRDRIWSMVSKFLVVAGVLLVIMAIVQVYFFEQPALGSFVYLHSFGAFLMLLAIPIAGYLLLAPTGRSSRRSLWVYSLVLLLLFFAIALTQGRGVTLSLSMALAILAALSYRYVPRHRIGLLFALLALGYLLANISLQGALGDRLATLANPETAGYERFRIWHASWELLQDTPWYGIGLGTYYLAWPPYRHPDENTLGFFVHNDYLQLWIEIGLPGLLLFIGVMLSVLWMMIQLWKRPRYKPATIKVGNT